MSLPVWAVVPASGVGRRMGAELPKQYLRVGGRSLLEHSLSRLLDHPRVEGAVLALAIQDNHWQRVGFEHDKPLLLTTGGVERLHSVHAALLTLHGHLAADALVLVHDAVRPFLLDDDLDRLIDQALGDDNGALLATPVADTLKRSDKTGAAVPPRVLDTVPRDGLWQALTPQAFRLSLLIQALEQAVSDDVPLTDDASAMELAGYSPRLVRGDRRNIKITHPEDLLLAEWIVRSLSSDG